MGCICGGRERGGCLGDDQDNAYLARDGEIAASESSDSLLNTAAV